MDLSNADSVQLARTTGDYITPQVINPTGPIEYLRNNQPVEIQTPKGSAVIAQEMERPFMPGPSLIQADLPQDQLAYKQNSIPVVNVSDAGEWIPVGGGFAGGTMYQNTVTKEMRFSQPAQIKKDKPKPAAVVMTQKPVQPSFSIIAIVAVVAVVLLIIAKW